MSSTLVTRGFVGCVFRKLENGRLFQRLLRAEILGQNLTLGCVFRVVSFDASFRYDL